MVVLWPLLLVVAAWWAWKRRGTPGGHGRQWFGAWAAAGFLMSLSLITGFSIGLFLLPLAAAVLLTVARRSPHAREATGFLVGVGATAAVVAAAAAF